MALKAKDFIKRILFTSLFTIFYLMIIQCFLAYPVSRVQANEIKNAMKSPEDEQAHWLSQWRHNVEQSQLYLYAVKLFKEPVDWEGKITDTYEGRKFGTITFTFTGGAKFMMETYPPESSRITLRVPNGFPNKVEACMVLEQYIRKKGVSLDWSKPKQQKNGSQLVKSYEPVDPELNAAAICVYKNEKLIEIGFSMAL